MATTPKTPLPPRILLEQAEDGTLIATYPMKRYRFMFSDGSTIDVVGMIRDDSDLRGAVLEITKAERIEGVARVDPAPVKAVSKRAVTKVTRTITTVG